MGLTKSEHYTTKQNQIAVLLKAIAHPARIAIIEYLLKKEVCICNDLVNHLPLSQPTVSQHLKELKNAGIIKGSIEGTSICYCLDEKSITMIENYFSIMNNKLKQTKSNCC
jgi:DNA-binding transcriptional ArsR family regulator